MYKLLSITTDTDKKHKLVAVFENKDSDPTAVFWRPVVLAYMESIPTAVFD